MAGYNPLYIRGNSTGLVQSRIEHILPPDAYPTLKNAYIFRERIKRKQGRLLLGKFQRTLTNFAEPNTDGTNTYQLDLLSTFKATEPDAIIVPGTVTIVIDSGGGNQTQYNDSFSLGTITHIAGPYTLTSGTINYSTGVVSLVFSVIPPGGTSVVVNLSYEPSLPAMGLRQEILQGINVWNTIGFDTKYAYLYGGTWDEFIPGTIWSGTDNDFFWSTNYWSDINSKPIFWVTNYTDPIRFTNGVVADGWQDFSPKIAVPGGATPDQFLLNCLCILPFRGRLVVFNTSETDGAHNQRIRWAAIGTPFTQAYGAFITQFNVDAWRDDIRGQGGFLDIPTTEEIISVGFVRDNLVIFCESSTWQLRYTGNSIAPFQVERVNAELGAKATFSSVQFDTSLVGIGDKGVVECDSFKSNRIDIKIPDLIFQFSDSSEGVTRVHGIRDFQQRLAYWTYPYAPEQSVSNIYPNQLLVYNYENDSWAIFDDSFTCLGTLLEQNELAWEDCDFTWQEANFTWVSTPTSFPLIIGGNQQGFVSVIGGNLQPQTSNDPTLSVKNITGRDTLATRITCPNHNLQSGEVISFSDIVDGPTTPNFSDSLNNPRTGNITDATQENPCQITSANHGLLDDNLILIQNIVGMTELNGNYFRITVIDDDNFTLQNVNSTDFDAYISGGTWEFLNAFGIQVIDINTFDIYKYDAGTGLFDIPQLDDSASVYWGGGRISVRDGFSIVSKKFNALEKGQQLQLGYIDALFNTTDKGAVTLNVYQNYNDDDPVNQYSENNIPVQDIADPFFNISVPTTSQNTLQGIVSSSEWQRIFCPSRGQFITIEWTLSNAQLVGFEQESEVEILSQIVWARAAGRLI